jgi:hypothetical protein
VEFLSHVDFCHSERTVFSHFSGYKSCSPPQTPPLNSHHTTAPPHSRGTKACISMTTNYDIKKARYCAAYCLESRQESGEEAIRHSPLVSLAVKCAIDDLRLPSDDETSNASASAAANPNGAITPVSPPTEATASASTSSDKQASSKPLAPRSAALGGGTLAPPFEPLLERETDPSSSATVVAFQHIALQAAYRNKSTEELRVEDYARDRRLPRVPILPQYGLLGFDMGNRDSDGNAEPILLNTNEPSSVFLCGSQGSGKSYTLSCMLENHLLKNSAVGVQNETIPGFVFHCDTNGKACLAEAASLCTRGIKVRVLVAWNNYKSMKKLYEGLGTLHGQKIEVRPLLFQDDDLTATHIQHLMLFDETANSSPVYLGVLLMILSRITRTTGKFSVNQFLFEQEVHPWQPGQNGMLEQRIDLLRAFTASATPAIVELENKDATPAIVRQKKFEQGVGLPGDCITVEKGTLTIVDLSGDFVDPATACTLFDICLSVILKRHQAKKISTGLVVALDEAHKYLDKAIPSAQRFTDSLLTTIREQRHNAARIIIATQELSIAGSLLDLCSVSIVHRFTSPAWFAAIRDHLGGASKMVKSDDDEEKDASRADLFRRILALEVGESLVFSPNSWVHGGEVSGGGQVVEPTRLGSRVLWMKTRKRDGVDSGKTVSVV